MNFGNHRMAKRNH